ncbi:MAG: toprim domain-containing protein [Bacteroidales bacterium]|nr:toprim domain-containing protein [Bacteroidales bacterium]
MINKIKQRLSCPDYLSRQGIYVKSGGRCISPLRPGAKNPTSFYCEDNYWYDFGSATGGDVIDLAAQLQYNGDIAMAVRELARELGIKSENVNASWRADIQHLCNRTAAYHEALTAEDYQYLAERGLTPEDANRLMIGRVTDGYLRGRLFLPYFKNGAVVYYATRALPGGAFAENKYMKASLDESRSYQHIPWGLHTLKNRSDILIISEGYFDAVSWEREGYAVLSPITGNFSKSQWPDVIAACRMFPKVLVIFDNDDVSHAGDGFTSRTANKLFQARIPFLVAHTPSGIKDVNDYYTQGGSLQALIDSAEDGLRYMAAQYTDAEALKKFILSINRYTDSTAIAVALFQPVLENRFAPAVLKSILKAAETAPSESQITDEIIAQRQLLYVNNVGFYEWNDKVWQFIPDLMVEKYADQQYGKRFSTYNRVKAVKNLLKSRAVCDVAFDRNPVMTFQNGTLEIESGTFRDFSPVDYCSIIMDYDYDPEARCPQWERFIEDVTDEEPRRAENLQFIAGYALVPDCRYQKIFCLLGNGSNGKSVYLEIIQALFGDKNISVVSPTGLTKEFERVKIKDSLLNIGKDVSPDFSTGEIREWLLQISDGTMIQACYKGQTHITFQPRCKLIYSMNKAPVASVIEGLNRRLRFIEFPCSFVDFPDKKNSKEKPKDVNIVSKLMAELPGIFNWAYAGYQLLNTVGYFTDTPEQADITRQFEEVSDPISVFCEDFEFSGERTRDEIYRWYRDWCELTGHKVMSRERFIPRFRDCMKDRILDERATKRSGKYVRLFVFATCD